MIKILAKSILVYGVICFCISAQIYGVTVANSTALGSFTVLVNVLGLATFWHLIFSKKSIALAVLVIIFKYLFLAVILWSLWSIKAINILGFITGLGSLLFAVLVLPIAKKLNTKLD